MEKLISSPPIVFLIFTVLFFIGAKLLGFLSSSGIRGERETDSYACGQKDVQHYVNPDYSQFFPFAFLFTIMHVLVLVVATAPFDALLLPVVVIASGALSLAIIFRR
jgi:NADH-quinone oxidoreductase subunit A